MLSIIGAGYAFPPGQIDDELLLRLDPGLSAADIGNKSGVSLRHTSLPIAYLRETANRDRSQAVALSSPSPSALGAEACKMAMERAPLRVEEIGELIGDTVTPCELCPAEAPRIAKLLGIKVRAWDLLGSASALISHIEMLGSLRPERVAPYTLCVSTNTPTHFIDYSSGEARFRYGDGASALLLSASVKGPLEILEAFSETNPAGGANLTFDVRGELFENSKALREYVETAAQRMVRLLNEKFRLCSSDVVICPQSDPLFLSSLLSSPYPCSFELQSKDYGDCLGAGVGIALARMWNRFRSGTRVFAIAAGAGLSSGYLAMKVL